MSKEVNIFLDRLIVHILDSNMQMPILSTIEQTLDEEVADFIGGHIVKILRDDTLKIGQFIDNESNLVNILKELSQDRDNFINVTCEMASQLYDIMYSNPDIPPGDVVFTLVEIDGQSFIGILKFNYKESYIHYVDSSEEGTINKIIKQKATLPSENQRIDECIFINLSDLGIRLEEKKYDINGQKDYYLSTIFLNCECNMSETEMVKKFKKATDSFSKKYCSDSIESAADLSGAISKNLEEKEEIDVDRVAEEAFRDDMEMKNAYIDHIVSAGVPDMKFEVNQEVAEKVFKKHRIKTDSGIEINFPYGYFNDRDKIEFINNPDGTISILIKNVKTV